MDKAAQWVQLDSDINVGKTKKTLKLVQVNQEKNQKFSDELVEGDQDDDKEVTDLIDQNDDDVDENLGVDDSNLLQLSDEEFDGVHGRGFSNPGPAW